MSFFLSHKIFLISGNDYDVTTAAINKKCFKTYRTNFNLYLIYVDIN